MPKPPPRNNPKSPKVAGNAPARPGKPREISSLLSGSGLASRAREFVRRQEDWGGFFAARLEPALLAAIGHYVEKDGTLTIFVDSAAWAARLRYALPDLWPAASEFRPGIARWTVKIQPVAARTGART
ncbi:MAG: DUF721 domain-containing protein [Gammaproteobacteria bacterium]|jgi:hypothetical protein|nr:DUF721 domain-containing protein [Gammaproteobacteria bacterium]NDB25685.1 DUF721 domain-containing protein [Gammaproteobacteria bacterium]